MLNQKTQTLPTDFTFSCITFTPWFGLSSTDNFLDVTAMLSDSSFMLFLSFPNIRSLSPPPPLPWVPGPLHVSYSGFETDRPEKCDHLIHSGQFTTSPKSPPTPNQLLKTHEFSFLPALKLRPVPPKTPVVQRATWRTLPVFCSVPSI